MDDRDIETNKVSPQDLLTEFRQFSVSRWCKWLDAFIAGEPHQPKIEVGPEELDSILHGLYEDLDDKGTQNRLSEAIMSYYEVTRVSEENAELIHLLLRVMADMKPIRAKRFLRRQLFDEIFLELNTKRVDSDYSTGASLDTTPEVLHTLLLSVVGEYDVDDDLSDYIDKSANKIKDHAYLLVCFRLLASGGGEEGFSLINRIIPLTKSEAEAEDLAMEIKAEFDRLGYRYFCLWYCNNASDLASRWPDQFSMFEERVMYEALPSDLEQFGDSEDRYLNLLKKQLYAALGRYTARQLVDIARLHKSFGIDIISSALCNIWRLSSNATPKKLRWHYISEYPSFAERTRPSTKRSIEVIRETGEPDWETFDAQEEPELEVIFERVKSFYVLGRALEKKEAEAEKVQTMAAGAAAGL